jgi:hypothetical protein
VPAVGISEVTDSLTVIVSEETGTISTAYKGKLDRAVDTAKLKEYLMRFQHRSMEETSRSPLLGRRAGRDKAAEQGSGSVANGQKGRNEGKEGSLKFLIIWASGSVRLLPLSSSGSLSQMSMIPITYLQFYNVPVKLTNTNLITDAGDVYMILDDSDVIPVVTVTAPRSIIDSLGEENIIATADVKNLSSLNTISISLSTNKYYNKIESISGSIDTVRLSVEKKASAHFTLKVNVTGTPASGYVQSDVTAGTEPDPSVRSGIGREGNQYGGSDGGCDRRIGYGYHQCGC